MRVCLITEKPSLGHKVFPYLLEMHPGIDRDTFACAFVNPFLHLNAYFRYPRGLALRDYPRTGEAAYEPFELSSKGDRRGMFLPYLGYRRASPDASRRDDGFPLGVRDGWPDPVGEATGRLLLADVVYAVVDPGNSSTLALDRCVRGMGLDRSRVAIPRITGFSDAELRASFTTPGRVGEGWYEADLAAARVRRRFDWGYQVNALAVHGRTLRLAGLPADAPVPSKYGLQLLYDLRANGPASEGRLLCRMGEWKGTVRYPRDETNRWVGIGGTASRLEIIGMLVRAGLADNSDPRDVRITDAGLHFLDMLHPDSEDRDLPFRLREWQGLPEADANARVDRYLRTFFGKQIRFLAKAGKGPKRHVPRR